MAQVTAIETVTYNGFTFPPESKIMVRADVVADQAGRTAVYVKHVIRVECMLAQQDTPVTGSNEGSRLPDVRRRLTSYGRSLRVTGTGYGDLSVNGATIAAGEGGATGAVTPKKDVVWGPKPRFLEWEPLGTLACRLVWTCEVAIPECTDAAYAFRLLAYNFNVSLAVDEQGYSTRTVSGYLEIPMTRKSDNARDMPDTADDYWTVETAPPIPYGFRRASQQTTLSEDKRRLNFSVTDIEMAATIFPEGVLDCRASHTASTHSSILFKYTSTIRAAYTLRRDIPKDKALFHFFNLVSYRLKKQQNWIVGFVPLSLTFEDPDIYGRQAANFALTYVYMITPRFNSFKIPYAELPFVPRFSALWSGSPQSNPATDGYPEWKESVKHEMEPRGHAGLRQRSKDDMIVDLCDTNLAVPAGAAFFDINIPGFQPRLLAPVPSKNFMFSAFGLDIVYRPGGTTTKKLVPAVAFSPASDVGSYFGAWISQAFNGAAPDPHNYQVRTETEADAILRYDVVSVGNPPEIPMLTSVGGLTRNQLVLGGTPGFGAGENRLDEVGFLFGVKVFRLQGYSRYRLLRLPPRKPGVPLDFSVNDQRFQQNPVPGGNALEINL